MTDWVQVKQYEDITYHKADGMARIAFNRPEVRNAFRPKTIDEMIEAFKSAWTDPEIGVILLTGNGPAQDGKYAFCAGGDQKVRGHAGYVDDHGVARLNVLELQRIIRTMPKPVIALVAGYAIGGGHVLHVICDLTIAADNAIFGQTCPKSAASTAATAQAIWRPSSGRRRRVKSGICAASTTRSRRSTWGWSTPSSQSISLRRKACSGRAKSSAKARLPSAS